MNLSKLKLLELFPENFRKDVDIICFCKAFDALFPKFVNKILRIRLFPRIEQLTSEECDFLAIEMKVDFYEQSWTLIQKQKALLKAFYFKLFKGTTQTLKDYIANIYAEAIVTEWFDYNGFPYHFKVKIEGETADPNLMDAFKRIIKKLKSQRSICDGVEYSTVKHSPTSVVAYTRRHKIVRTHLPLP